MNTYIVLFKKENKTKLNKLVIEASNIYDLVCELQMNHLYSYEFDNIANISLSD